MKIAVDISLYPLDADFIPPIKDVIARINRHENISVETNAMSTQIVGDYNDVMQILQQEMKSSFEQLPRAVFAIKVLQRPEK